MAANVNILAIGCRLLHINNKYMKISDVVVPIGAPSRVGLCQSSPSQGHFLVPVSSSKVHR